MTLHFRLHFDFRHHSIACWAACCYTVGRISLRRKSAPSVYVTCTIPLRQLLRRYSPSFYSTRSPFCLFIRYQLGTILACAKTFYYNAALLIKPGLRTLAAGCVHEQEQTNSKHKTTNLVLFQIPRHLPPSLPFSIWRSVRYIVVLFHFRRCLQISPFHHPFGLFSAVHFQCDTAVFSGATFLYVLQNDLLL